MRSIAFINQKGGVGKTTTAVNVSAGLAERGQRVLLIDLDPQAHAGLHLGVELGPGEKSVYDVLVRGTGLAETFRRVGERLTVVPAHIDLVAAEMELSDQPDREMVLSRALEPLRDRFDTLVIDCPPSLGVLPINALAAVEEVIIPLQPHFLALQGLGKLLETISLVRGVLKPALRISGVVLCLYEKMTRLAHEVRNDVSQFIRDAEFQDAWFGACVFETCIRRNIKLAEAVSFGKTIYDYAPRSAGAQDYAALSAEIADMAATTPVPAEQVVAVGQAPLERVANPHAAEGAPPASDGPLTTIPAAPLPAPKP